MNLKAYIFVFLFPALSNAQYMMEQVGQQHANPNNLSRGFKTGVDLANQQMDAKIRRLENELDNMKRLNEQMELFNQCVLFLQETMGDSGAPLVEKKCGKYLE